MSIFSKAIIVITFPDNFKMPSIAFYDGKEDPVMHVEVFHALMDCEKVAKLSRCRAFPLTLLRLAQSWHSKFLTESIISFEQLA